MNTQDKRWMLALLKNGDKLNPIAKHALIRYLLAQYKSVESSNQLNCTYCELAPTSQDHIPPVSYIRNLLYSKDYAKYFQLELLIVPACNQCNSKLGDKPLLTIEERRRYINSAHCS